MRKPGQPSTAVYFAPPTTVSWLVLVSLLLSMLFYNVVLRRHQWGGIVRLPPNFPLVNHGHSPSRRPILTSILSLGLSHSLLFRLSLDPTHGHSLRLIVSTSRRLSPTPEISLSL